MQPNRLFLALVPNDEVRKQMLAAARDLIIKMQPSGNRIPSEKYHLTMAFLGDAVPPEQEASAIKALELLRAAPFSVTLDQASSFKDAGAWWLGMRNESAALLELRKQIQWALTSQRVTYDRRFTPHVTFIRAKQPLAPTSIKPIPWSVSELVLLRSQIEQGMPEYEVVAKVRLEGSAPRESEQMSLL